ncbi:MAG: YHS domain-containing protein [Chitinophagales bacterium]
MNYQTLLGWAVLIVVLWFMMRRGGCCGGSTGEHHSGGGGGCCGGGHAVPSRKPGSEKETAVDPICGMTVQKSTALSATVDGQDYYFCNPACRDEFLKTKGDGHGGHGTGHSGRCC